MAKLSAADARFLDVTLDMTGGYCLDFSDRTFSGFFAEAINYDIDEPHNYAEGGSKGKRMRYFLRMTDDRTAARLLRALWEYRQDMLERVSAAPDNPGSAERFQQIVARLESGGGGVRTDVIERFSADETLEELVASIQRDVDAAKPEAALDRLHTYCMKKLAHLLALHAAGTAPAATLNARLGQYLNSTGRRAAKAHHPVSFEIMTGAVKTFELFNGVRNDHSFAHDNALIGKVEARFIFDAIVNTLRFIKATEGQTFERMPPAPPPAPVRAPWDEDLPF